MNKIEEVKKFRKKPVVIDAVQFTGEKNNIAEVVKFCPNIMLYGTTSNAWLSIKTLEGNHRADVGDWIIKGVKGEFYPCKPDIFEQTYEPVI